MLDHHWIQFGAVPAILAFAAVGIIRFVAGPTIGPRIASSGVSIAVLMSVTIGSGSVTLLNDRLFLIMSALVALGLVADVLFHSVRPLMRTLFIAAPLLALLWMTNPQLSGPLLLETALFGACFVAIAVILFSFSDFEPTNATPVVLLAMAALGIGLVLLLAGEQFGGGVSLSASGAVAAFFLWNFPKQRFAVGGGLMIGVAALLLLLASAAVIEGAANRLSLAILTLVFFADKIFRLPVFSSRAGRAVAPFVLAGVSGIVVLAAIAAAMLTTL